MRALLASLAGAEIVVPGVGLCRLRHASVMEALHIIVALQDLGEDGGWEALRDACRDWLPENLHAFYFGPEAWPVGTARDIGELLSAGVDKKKHLADRKKVEEDARERSWHEIIADYADAMSMKPREVLEEPWPFFVAMCAEVRRLKALRQVDFMLGYATARSGDKELWRSRLDEAGYGAPKSDAAWNPNPEWEAEQRRKIKAYQQKFFGIKGEA